ncbi:hypothetical protein RhiirA5_434931 [Rhizophagus irregularis]|uniref:Uncharacterized protein n=1 Tax=Rhizophagus irregularis TaxID=588596 RepID=A0A2N0NPB7_9GLOM|nr:hypothetical protein RhiirA5_434931 [Rhizophagus irregularis]
MMIPKSNSIWNEFLYKPKSILFYNLDSNHFYNWWNFAAIIDFKVFESFGIYFAIIIGVVKKVFPFLVVLLFIVLGYAQAFFIVLRSNSINDDNDPRNVATKYVFVNPDGTITVYNLLTGDSGSLLSFTYREHSIMTILLTVFNYPPFISKKLRELVAFSDDNNKLEKKIDQLTKQNIEFKEDLIKQNVELKQQLEHNEEVQDNEKIQDNKGEQDNKLEMQKEQTKEELSKQKLDLNNK